MLTIGTRVKIIAFLVVGIAVVVYVGLRYADLGRYVGVSGYYVVKLDVSDSGGIFTNAEVTYRGVPVGRVGDLNLTTTGVEVDLRIDDTAPRIPASVRAVVADRSAVGEQYVDLRPARNSAPYLAGGSTIRRQDTTLPPPVQDVLSNVDSLAASVPGQSLRTVVDQLYDATNGQGPNLQILLDSSSALAATALRSVPQQTALIGDSQTVLATQSAESDALAAFGRNAKLLAGQLDSSDPDLRTLIDTAPQAVGQVSGVLRDTDPGLSVLLANLLTTSEVTMTRRHGIEELLSVTPAAVAAGSSVITNDGATFGLALTFFDPKPCMAGYQGTADRNGLDVSPQEPLNVHASCTLPPSSGVDVRGSANAPSGGPVPAPVVPGALRNLRQPIGPTTLAGLLGIGK
ncbi:MAG TPA: MlaD family protein [Pseudonocardiaceae bacterium]|jgi:phospholipid/cholesterol/gamma-HCH transport system substrate-binding protein|nr:MlaD family protein [Pseudonocardiaceae bacterium]